MLSPPVSVHEVPTFERSARTLLPRLSQSSQKAHRGMAYDLQTRFYKLRTPISESPPLSPTSQTALSRKNGDYNAIRQLPAEDRNILADVADSSGNLSLSTRAADIDTNWLGCGGDANDLTTSPINVPASSNKANNTLIDGPIHQSHYHEPSPLEEFLKNRRPSISFNPHVTLESGELRKLEEPLPEVGFNTGLRNRPILQDLSGHSSRSSPLSRFYNVEQEQHSSFTDRPQFRTRPTQHRHHYPLLPSTAYRIASDKGQSEFEQGVSLTSASTASPVRSEIQTPLEGAMNCLVSSISPFSSFHHPTSLEESSAWPIVQQPGSVPARAKSYSLNRKSSVRQGFRQSSRRSSTSSASSASAYLSRFGREEAVADPDAEGQEVGEYVLGKSIGFGGSSVVKEAYTIEGDRRICRAVKIVRKQVTGKEDLENEQFQAEFEREVDLWRCLHHRYILPLIAVHVTNFATFCFSTLSAGGTLFDLIKSNRQGISPNRARRYTYQLASAIRYLHEDMRIVHRDIKLENCLVDLSGPGTDTEGGHVLLCDFGMAEFITDENIQNSSPPYDAATDRPPLSPLGPPETSTSIAGTLQYLSPELILGPTGFLSRVVDVWAFGVVVYTLLTGDLPFQHSLPARVRMMILCGELNREALHRAGEAGRMENEVMELVQGCLDMESESRWTIRQVLDCRWLNGCEEMLEEIHESWKL